MKHSPQAITTALQLYFSGESLRNTQKSLRLLGVEVVHSTIYKWIKKYIGLMEKYIDKLKPEVSNTWRADELWMKFKGDMKYVFAIMDDETRYWIAQEVAETKYKHDARTLFQLARKVTGKKPETIITDGLRSYHIAYKKEKGIRHYGYCCVFRQAQPLGQLEFHLLDSSCETSYLKIAGKGYC